MQPVADDWQAMVLASASGVLLHDAETKSILWANPVACEMFGFTLDELRPLKAHHMSAQERQYRREVGVAWLQEAVDRGRSQIRWKYRAKDGAMFLTDAVATLVELSRGPVVMVQFRRVLDSEQRHDDLVRAASYLDRLMTHTSVGVLLLDEGMRILDADPRVARLLGVPHPELLGASLGEVLEVDGGRGSLEPRPIVPGRMVELLLRREVAGRQLWLSGALEDIAHDGTTSRLLVVRDVTERVEVERIASVQDSKLQYLSRYHAMGDMAMIIAHELGQPLAAATNFVFGVGAALEGSDEPERLDLGYGLEHAKRALSRATMIVSSVKRYVARIEPSERAHDLRRVVQDVRYFHDLRARQRDVELVVDLGTEELPIRGDAILLGQVVTNIVFNAIDEAEQPSATRRRVTVDLRRDAQGCATVAVRDWGRGMAVGGSERLTGPAFTDKSDGAGIGLLVSERIAERHGGRISYELGEGGGTLVTLHLPVNASTV